MIRLVCIPRIESVMLHCNVGLLLFIPDGT